MLWGYTGFLGMPETRDNEIADKLARSGSVQRLLDLSLSWGSLGRI
jgi:hypothetical protein